MERLVNNRRWGIDIVPASIRVGVTFLLGAIILWLALRQVNLAELWQALSQARLTWIGVGLSVMVLTILVKTWRWQLLYHPIEPKPSFATLFWAMSLGQFINLGVRLGEVARIYAVEQEMPAFKARSLGTLVVEKSLDSLFLGLTILLVLPYIVLPSYVTNYLPLLVGITTLVALGLYIIAYRTEQLVHLLKRGLHFVPAQLRSKLGRIILSGLEGLSALRNPRQTLYLLTISALIAFLSILTPWVLFPTFALPYGFLEAILIHALLTIGLTPPSTPAKMGVFEWLTIGVLALFGWQNEAIALSYALVFHWVILLPQIGLGITAATQFNWHELWQKP